MVKFKYTHETLPKTPGIVGSFCRYRRALYFWSLGISLYLELFRFLSFITFVLRNLCSEYTSEPQASLNSRFEESIKYLNFFIMCISSSEGCR